MKKLNLKPPEDYAIPYVEPFAVGKGVEPLANPDPDLINVMPIEPIQPWGYKKSDKK